MDLDKPLDDMISAKKRSTPNNNANAKPRQSRERRDVPYARPPPRSTEDKWVHDAFAGPGARRGQQGAPGGANRNVANVSGTGALFTGISPRIEVTGLHYEVTPQDLKTIFSQAGTLVQGPTIRNKAHADAFFFPSPADQISHISTLQYDYSGRSKGEATMEFASYQQAKIAINKFDGAMTRGQTISIKLLPPVVQRGPAGKPQGQGQVAPGGNLLARISGGGGGASSAPNGPRGGMRGGRGGPRGAPRGRGAPGGARGGGRKPPASAGDLDSELDSFMKPDKSGDVEMA